MRKYIILLLACLLLAACGNDSESNNGNGNSGESVAFSEMVGDPVAGKAAYDTTCFACHGLDAAGLPNLGKDLTTSGLVKGLTDEQLVEFIIKGRTVNDPANTTGSDMPPRGGNPTLSDQDLFNIVAYLRTLEK